MDYFEAKFDLIAATTFHALYESHNRDGRQVVLDRDAFDLMGEPETLTVKVRVGSVVGKPT